MQKSQKMELKWTKNGAQIGPKSRKSRKKGMHKSMLKFDAERVGQKSLSIVNVTDPGSPWGRFLGGPGGVGEGR